MLLIQLSLNQISLYYHVCSVHQLTFLERVVFIDQNNKKGFDFLSGRFASTFAIILKKHGVTQTTKCYDALKTRGTFT